MSTEKNQFNYSLYKSKWISVEKLDMIATNIFSGSGSSTFSKIVGCVKMIVACAYIFGRKYLIDQEMMIEKQQYEQNQHDQNNDDVNTDDNLGV